MLYLITLRFCFLRSGPLDFKVPKIGPLVTSRVAHTRAYRNRETVRRRPGQQSVNKRAPTIARRVHNIVVIYSIVTSNELIAVAFPRSLKCVILLLCTNTYACALCTYVYMTRPYGGHYYTLLLFVVISSRCVRSILFTASFCYWEYRRKNTIRA